MTLSLDLSQFPSLRVILGLLQLCYGEARNIAWTFSMCAQKCEQIVSVQQEAPPGWTACTAGCRGRCTACPRNSSWTPVPCPRVIMNPALLAPPAMNLPCTGECMHTRTACMLVSDLLPLARCSEVLSHVFITVTLHFFECLISSSHPWWHLCGDSWGGFHPVSHFSCSCPLEVGSDCAQLSFCEHCRGLSMVVW